MYVHNIQQNIDTNAEHTCNYAADLIIEYSVSKKRNSARKRAASFAICGARCQSPNKGPVGAILRSYWHRGNYETREVVFVAAIAIISRSANRKLPCGRLPKLSAFQTLLLKQKDAFVWKRKDPFCAREHPLKGFASDACIERIHLQSTRQKPLDAISQLNNLS